MKALSASAERVQAALEACGLEGKVVELPQSTRTAVDAASALECEVAQIAKSLIFKGKNTGDPVLVIASGINRVKEALVAEAIGEPIGKADADFVRARTGFAIGGVAPVGHLEAIRTVMDEDLLALDPVWAAAGTPNAVVRLDAKKLAEATGATVTAVKQ